MLSVKRLVTIDSPWATMHPLRLGRVPSALGTPDLFVTISDDDRPLLRADLYRDSSSETSPFQDALVWREQVFVGFAHRVYVIDPKNQSGSEILLGNGCGYFRTFYASQDYLLVASGECLLRLSPDGKVLWRSPNLGLDGVEVTSVDDGTIRGLGEWDPPGGCISRLIARCRLPRRERPKKIIGSSRRVWRGSGPLALIDKLLAVPAGEHLP
jgi:hypothetical protein